MKKSTLALILAVCAVGSALNLWNVNKRTEITLPMQWDESGKEDTDHLDTPNQSTDKEDISENKGDLSNGASNGAENDFLESENNVEFVIDQIKNVLNAYFCTETNCSVEPCIEEALNKGEDMLMLYKSKQTSKRKADIYLQLLDNGMYCPNLFVYDQDGTEILHQKLPCTFDLMSLGEIQLSSKKVVVKPRKNSLATQLEPMEFEL
jgi:hypothetical protein